MNLTPLERTELRAAILARHPSLYAFSKATGVTKSVVLQVLAGRYPGNVARQAARMRAALAGAPPAVSGWEPPTPAAIHEALERVACARCRVTDKRRCKSCRALWDRQAAEVAALYAAAASSQIG